MTDLMHKLQKASFQDTILTQMSAVGAIHIEGGFPELICTWMEDPGGPSEKRKDLYLKGQLSFRDSSQLPPTVRKLCVLVLGRLVVSLLRLR